MSEVKLNSTKIKPLALFLSVVQSVLILALVTVAITSFGSRIPWLAQHGVTFYTITSGSMEPAIPTGSLVYAGSYKLEELAKDDVLTFTVPSADSSKPLIVTHRISDVQKKETFQKDPDGKEEKTTEYIFKTKGDANNTEDSQTLAAGNILGKYKWHIPHIGRVSIFAQTFMGFITLIILPAGALIVWEVISVILHFKQEYQLKSKSEIETLKAKLAEHEKAN